MISTIFSTLVYDPIYNLLIFILSTFPLFDVGVAVVLVTLLVKLLLFPLSMKAARTQLLMKELETPLKEIKEKYKKDKQEQAQHTFALYKEKGVNPFSSVLVMLIQIPVILGLFFVFADGGLPEIDTTILYSFIVAPQEIHMVFLGLIHMGQQSLVLAGLAGVTQFIQARLTLPTPTERKDDATLQEDLARSMNIQMRYVLPVVIAVFAYVASAAVALYWMTSNIFAIGQELYVRKTLKKDQE